MLYILYQPHYRQYNKISVYHAGKWRGKWINNDGNLFTYYNIKFLLYHFAKYNREPIRVKLNNIYINKVYLDANINTYDFRVFNINNMLRKKYNNINIYNFLDYVRDVPLFALFQYFTVNHRDNKDSVELYINDANNNIICGADFYNKIQKNRCNIQIIIEKGITYLEIREKI
jgi:hypothetical protein